MHILPFNEAFLPTWGARTSAFDRVLEATATTTHADSGCAMAVAFFRAIRAAPKIPILNFPSTMVLLYEESMHYAYLYR